ncbi:MAG: enoyl-CoA hydratase/isomerase family protein [Euryarchaeota archaeon]|nr:enoyl-CoA hydratase/isomerase family protein [Euryarchaeota archaeon]
MMSGALVELFVENSTAYVCINNPPVNIVDAPVLDKLCQIIDTIEQDSSIRAMVLYSAGEKGFSAGASIEEHLPEVASSMIEQMTCILERLQETPLITLSEVHGLCLGGGAELAFACDFLISTSDAKIGVPEVTVGCYPPFAMMQLPNAVGMRIAKEIILSGRMISGERAYEIGLANKISSREEMRETTNNMLKPILRNPPNIISLTLAHLRNIQNGKTNPGHRVMGEGFITDLIENKDYFEGLTSFLEKRRPEWKLDRTGKSTGDE